MLLFGRWPGSPLCEPVVVTVPRKLWRCAGRDSLRARGWLRRQQRPLCARLCSSRARELLGTQGVVAALQLHRQTSRLALEGPKCGAWLCVPRTEPEPLPRRSRRPAGGKAAPVCSPGGCRCRLAALGSRLSSAASAAPARPGQGWGGCSEREGARASWQQPQPQHSPCSRR